MDVGKLNETGTKVISLKEINPASIHLVFTDSELTLLNSDSLLIPGGFLLFTGSSDALKTFQNYEPISNHRIQLDGCLQFFVLLRKISMKTEAASVISTDEKHFNWVESAKDIIQNANMKRIVFASTNPNSGINGFVKCLVKEFSNLNIQCFHAIDQLELNFVNPTKYLQDQLNKDLLYNIYSGGLWGYFSNLSIPVDDFRRQKVFERVYANALKLGDLSSLTWIESPLRYSKQPLVEVHYSSLNFKDIMLASGQLNQASIGGSKQDDCVLGLEFSGTLKGKRVFGFGDSKCLATHVDPKNLTLFDIPPQWSYEEAVTVPAVYMTVYLALIVRGRMECGETVLIHAGAGGIGQAAITLALSMNCKVFTTVSTLEKKNFLKTRFPCLTDENFANSRDPEEFKIHIQKYTDGHGVNLVLNSLSQESLKASIDCLSRHGRFLEIGKFDLFNDTSIGLNVLLKGASLYGIHVDKTFEDGNAKEIETLKQHIRDGIKSGVIRPLNFTIFKADQLEEAFRFMAQGKHIGKVILKIKEHENTPAAISATPRTHFDNRKSYIIIGGLGGMGFELTSWMISRGAEKFILVSRTGVKSTYHEYHISRWEKQGVKIIISRFDSATTEGAHNLLQHADNLAPVGGIFNTAVVLKDALFENQTPDTFTECVMCKAYATINLDRLSRQFAPELDYFVVFSSISAGRGNPGQTNYGYANSVMERICEKRQRDGFHALAVQWGAVGDVGVLHRQIVDRKTGLVSSLLPQKIQSCLEMLDIFLQQQKPVVSSFLAAEKEIIAASDAKNSMVHTVARILGIKDVSKVNPESSLVDLGMDSLMSSELSQVLTSRGNIMIPPKWQSQLTFEKLAQLDKCEGDMEENNVELWKRNIESSSFGEEKMQDVENAVLFGMLQQYTDNINSSVVNELSQIKTAEGKWQLMASILKDSCSGFSRDEVDSFTMSCKVRMDCAKNYVAFGKVKAKTVLIKALQTGTIKAVAYDYKLNEVCDQPTAQICRPINLNLFLRFLIELKV
ncbi:unnamed protein product [Allacma fusca]|uniref:Uncharacterized protein n=1 Tax=Allacma fusca TaxID=39272 RepID=A0A8J2J481_9HEXA|nr:unnamed protein product [Allacma fusca]